MGAGPSLPSQSTHPQVGAGVPGGPVLLRSKLRPPAVRGGLIARARLDALLEAGARGRLCLVDAPAGSGKTGPSRC
jgi:LuxR family transcriptional regulator, maltose regulon positive regulatory protein